MTLSNPLADALSSLYLEFVPQMALQVGESVWLGLPSFSLLGGGEEGGGAGGAIAVALTGVSNGSFVATWVNATQERPVESVRLHVTSHLVALAPQSLTIAAAASGGGGVVRVPTLGLRRCDAAVGEGTEIAKKCMSLSTDAAEGPVQTGVAIENAPAVGSFGSSSTVQWCVFMRVRAIH